MRLFLARVATRAVRSTWTSVLLIILAALGAFGWDVASEPFFADESAYFSQSYFAATFAAGRWNDPSWLEYPGCDLPPFPKYLIGFALWVGGYQTPGPADAMTWYEKDTMARFDAPGALTVARMPMVVVGVVGCLAIYGIGVLAAGRGAGLLSAGLLIANPLYRLHTRRAMSDVPCEAFVLLGLFFGLRVWQRQLSIGTRPAVPLAIGSGLCAGLAMLSKLSGLLGLMVLAAWTVLAISARASAARKIGVATLAVVSAATALIVFVMLNPFLTAHPSVAIHPAIAAVDRMSLGERVQLMLRLRLRVAANQKLSFSHNALHGPAERLAVSVVQGFGRFGPFGPSHSDSTRRFDPRQDWGLVLWLPWVVAGAVHAAFRGRSQRRNDEPPTAWAVLVHFCVAFAVVTLYLPMAWDRYLLPIQAPAALLASGVAVAGFRQAVAFRRRRTAG